MALADPYMPCPDPCCPKRQAFHPHSAPTLNLDGSESNKHQNPSRIANPSLDRHDPYGISSTPETPSPDLIDLGLGENKICEKF